MKNAYFLMMLCIGSIASAQTIEKFSIDNGGLSATQGNIQILYTLGEVHVQEASVNTIVLSEGFINPETSNTLSIDKEVGVDIKIYPNPVSKILYISVNQTLESVELYNVLGKEVYAAKHRHQIDVSRFQHGMYVLKIKTIRGILTKKIIIN